MNIENIKTVKDFVLAFRDFLKQLDYGWEYSGDNPFIRNRKGFRSSRIEKALLLFSKTIGFEGDIVDLEEWFNDIE